jgi:hypothetical protein
MLPYRQFVFWSSYAPFVRLCGHLAAHGHSWSVHARSSLVSDAPCLIPRTAAVAIALEASKRLPCCWVGIFAGHLLRIRDEHLPRCLDCPTT